MAHSDGAVAFFIPITISNSATHTGKSKFKRD